LKVKKICSKIYGKWILRKTFSNVLPPEIIYRRKKAIEYGSGITKLRKIIESKISNQEFKSKKLLYGLNFMSTEHLYYYEVYRAIFGDILETKYIIKKVKNNDEKRCVCCGSVLKDKMHCRLCGTVNTD
jgi:asparagine synthase (glutamine-hydrolysing)